jgi:hypothetical protein
LPRSWIPNGLIIIPCLTEKGVRGTFDLEVYASEKVYLNQLPETYSRTIAGDWNETCAGGSHVSPTWKKNPKYNLTFHFPIHSEAPARVRITLAKYGASWKQMSRKDTVSCMIGFYIFSSHHGALTQVYESIFVPDNELSTDSSFTLSQLPRGDFYIIMPATFLDGVIGSFVISILSEVEFMLGKEK